MRHQAQVITNHQNLELIQTAKLLNWQQAQWAQERAGYDFKIFLRPGQYNETADCLLRRPEYRLEKGEDKKPEPILKTDNLIEDYIIPLDYKDRICSIPPIQWRKDFLEDIWNTVRQDQQDQSGLLSLRANPDSSNYIKPSEHLTVESNNILDYRGRRYIPNLIIPKIFESEYDSKVAGYFI